MSDDTGLNSNQSLLPWPPNFESVPIDELIAPLIGIADLAYDINLRNDVTGHYDYQNYCLGAQEQGQYPEPDQMFTDEYFKAQAKLGQTPLHTILTLAVLLGMEQGRMIFCYRQANKYGAHHRYDHESHSIVHVALSESVQETLARIFIKKADADQVSFLRNWPDLERETIKDFSILLLEAVNHYYILQRKNSDIDAAQHYTGYDTAKDRLSPLDRLSTENIELGYGYGDLNVMRALILIAIGLGEVQGKRTLQADPDFAAWLADIEKNKNEIDTMRPIV